MVVDAAMASGTWRCWVDRSVFGVDDSSRGSIELGVRASSLSRIKKSEVGGRSFFLAKVFKKTLRDLRRITETYEDLRRLRKTYEDFHKIGRLSETFRDFNLSST